MSSWANLRSQAEVGRRVALAVPCGACQMVIFFYQGPPPDPKEKKHLTWGKYRFAVGPQRGEKVTAASGKHCLVCGVDLTLPRVLNATFDPRRWNEIRMDSIPTTPTGVGGPPPPSVGPKRDRPRPDNGGGGGDGGERVPPRVPPPPPGGAGAYPELPPPRATIYEILPGKAEPAVFVPRGPRKGPNGDR